MNNFTIPIQLENMGGCRSFKYLNRQNIISIPPVVNLELSTPPILYHSSAWMDGYASDDTLIYSENSSDNAAGTYYKQSIKGFYPSQSAIMTALFTEMQKYRFVVIVKDANGKYRMVGTPTEPLKFSWSFTTETRASNRPGYDFSFQGETTNPAPFLTYTP